MINTIWENHIDKFVQIILKKLETTDCEKRVFMRVEYSLRVIIMSNLKCFKVYKVWNINFFWQILKFVFLL